MNACPEEMVNIGFSREGIVANELILRISGASITAEKFEQGIRAFLGIIKDVAADVSGSKKGVRWLVELEPGSIQVIFRAEPIKAGPEQISTISSAIADGLAILEEKAERPPHFSDNALRDAKKLGQIIDATGEELEQVRVARNGTALNISQKTAANVDTLIGVYVKDIGTVEGRLSVVSERNGYSIQIYDLLSGKPTKCIISEDLLPMVLKSFGQRVAATGEIRYRRDGQRLSIKVREGEDFFVFPEPDSFPSIEHMRGLFGRGK